MAREKAPVAVVVEGSAVPRGPARRLRLGQLAPRELSSASGPVEGIGALLKPCEVEEPVGVLDRPIERHDTRTGHATVSRRVERRIG